MGHAIFSLFYEISFYLYSRELIRGIALIQRPRWKCIVYVSVPFPFISWHRNLLSSFPRNRNYGHMKNDFSERSHIYSLNPFSCAYNTHFCWYYNHIMFSIVRDMCRELLTSSLLRHPYMSRIFFFSSFIQIASRRCEPSSYPIYLRESSIVYLVSCLRVYEKKKIVYRIQHISIYNTQRHRQHTMQKSVCTA